MWPASCSTRRRIARATRNFPVPVSEALSERSTLDGEDSLLDLMREEPAISREYGLRQEILAVHPERRVHDAPPRGIFVSNAAHTRHGSSTKK